jgi:hypothetical protein
MPFSFDPYGDLSDDESATLESAGVDYLMMYGVGPDEDVYSNERMDEINSVGEICESIMDSMYDQDSSNHI